MIDDKKIEAAKEEIYEDRFLLNGEEVVFDNDAKEEMFYKEDIKEAIELGANWAINEFLKDLWHPASEEPERDRDILLEYENGHPSDARMRLPYQYENIYSDLCKKYWSVMVKIEKITRWFYIDDLLPKEGGEQ